LIEIINKQLLLQLVGYLCYWQMGFNSVFKGLNPRFLDHIQSLVIPWRGVVQSKSCCVRLWDPVYVTLYLKCLVTSGYYRFKHKRT